MNLSADERLPMSASERKLRARLHSQVQAWREKSERCRHPTRKKGVRILGIDGMTRNSCAKEIEAILGSTPCECTDQTPDGVMCRACGGRIEAEKEL